MTLIEYCSKKLKTHYNIKNLLNNKKEIKLLKNKKKDLLGMNKKIYKK
jgi:hypothetical protein